jgi:hypothetical protein
MRFQMRLHISFLRKPFIAPMESTLMRLFTRMGHYMRFQRVSATKRRIANFAFKRPNVKVSF